MRTLRRAAKHMLSATELKSCCLFLSSRSRNVSRKAPYPDARSQLASTGSSARQIVLCHFKSLNVTQKSSAARMHCGVAITKQSTNKHLSFSIVASVADKKHPARAPPESASVFLRLPLTPLRPNATYPSAPFFITNSRPAYQLSKYSKEHMSSFRFPPSTRRLPAVLRSLPRRELRWS